MANVDIGDSQPIPRMPHRGSPRLQGYVGRLGQLIALGAKLGYYRDFYGRHHRFDHLGEFIQVVPEARSRFLSCGFPRTREVEGHVGTAEVQLDRMGSRILELLCQPSPPLVVLSIVGNVGHEDKIVVGGGPPLLQ